MRKPRIAVVIPTISSRQELCAMAVKDYEELTPNVLISVVHDAPNCGAGWQQGVEQIQNEAWDYLHLSADDIEPLPNWWEQAVDRCGEGSIPNALVFRPDGSVESGARWQYRGTRGEKAILAQVPFCSRKQWEKIGPMVPIQYYSDNWFTWRAEQAGWPCLHEPSYRFVHHRPRNPRPGEQNQMIADYAAYQLFQSRGPDWRSE